MRHMIILAIAVVAGIWVYRRITAAKPKATGPLSQGLYFSAGDLDPQTGAQLNPGAMPDTVNFSAQGN